MEGKRIEIRWRDLDALGHVNQAVYHTFLEEIADDWLRRVLGLEEGRVWDYVLARSTINYRNELRLADRAVVGTCRVLAVGTSSVTVGFELRADDGRLAADGDSVLVTWDTQARRSRPLTDDERTRLEPAA